MNNQQLFRWHLLFHHQTYIRCLLNHIHPHHDASYISTCMYRSELHVCKGTLWMILPYLSCNKLAQVVIVRYDIKSLGMALLQEYRLHVPFWDTNEQPQKYHHSFSTWENNFHTTIFWCNGRTCTSLINNSVNFERHLTWPSSTDPAGPPGPQDGIIVIIWSISTTTVCCFHAVHAV